MDPSSIDAISQLTGPIPTSPDRNAVIICIHHSGRCFRTTFDRASMFVRRSHAQIDAGTAELVPLLHEHGVEMLYVSANTPLLVHDLRDHSFDALHPRQGD